MESVHDTHKEELMQLAEWKVAEKRAAVKVAEEAAEQKMLVRVLPLRRNCIKHRLVSSLPRRLAFGSHSVIEPYATLLGDVHILYVEFIWVSLVADRCLWILCVKRCKHQ